ncbi:hypothetical protein LguiA_027853 [Lonicera macranthoides]
MMKEFSIPLGFRFSPRDDELIHYLLCKIKDTKLPCNGIILEADLFGETPPWQLFSNAGYHGGDGYFFTKLKHKTENGKNFKRTVDNIGTWKGDAKAVNIRDPKTGSVIGEKRTLNFKTTNNKCDDGDCKWLMTEYGLAEVMLKYKRSRADYVLCRIRKKNLQKKQEQVEDEDSNMDDSDAAVGVGDDGATTSGTSSQILETMSPMNTISGPSGYYLESDSKNPVSEEYCNIINNNYYYNQLQNNPQGYLPKCESSAQTVGEEYKNNEISHQTFTQLLAGDGSAQPNGVELVPNYNFELVEVDGELMVAFGQNKTL